MSSGRKGPSERAVKVCSKNDADWGRINGGHCTGCGAGYQLYGTLCLVCALTVDANSSRAGCASGTAALDGHKPAVEEGDTPALEAARTSPPAADRETARDRSVGTYSPGPSSETEE